MSEVGGQKSEKQVPESSIEGVREPTRNS